MAKLMAQGWMYKVNGWQRSIYLLGRRKTKDERGEMSDFPPRRPSFVLCLNR